MIVTGSPQTYFFDGNMLSALGGLYDLPQPGYGDPYTVGLSINDSGQIAGQSLADSGEGHAFLWTPGGMDGMVSNPQMKDLGTLGGADSQAYAVNNSGVVAGFSYDGAYNIHAFVSDGAGMRDLGTLGGSYSSAFAINSSGTMAGVSTTPVIGESHACIWAAPYPPLNRARPVTSASLTGTQGSQGWYRSPVTLTLTASDTDSTALTSYYRVDGGATMSYSSPFTVGGDRTHTIEYWSVDAHNITEWPHPSQQIKIDSTPPTISAASGAFLLNQPATPVYSVSDNLSGVASSSATAINTSTAGAKTFTVTAADAACNTATQVVPYTVAYAITPLYDQTRAVHGGAAYAIKLYLADYAAIDVSTPSVVVHAIGITQLSTNSPGTLTTPGNSNPDTNFHFDATLGPNGGYVFNLSTSGLTTGTYTLNFTAGADPTTHSVQFQVK